MVFHKIFSTKYDSWLNLEKAIESLPTSNDRGEVFEQFVYLYFSLNQNYYQISEIYREKEIPLAHKEKLKLEKTDYGVDGIFIKTDGTYTVYQVKFRSNKGVPTVRELSTFWTEGEYADYRCIIANCEDLPKVSQKKSGSMQILARDFDKLDDSFFENLVKIYNGSKPIKPKTAEPDPHQDRMIKNIVAGFNNNDKGKLIAACGIGKTLVSLWSIEKLLSKKILFLAPSLALIKQTLAEWSKHTQNRFSYLCVCSDASVKLEQEQDIADLDISEVDFPVTTDPEIISKFMLQENKFSVIFSTYHSVGAIANAMNSNEFEFDIVIFDEAHRTAGTKNSEMFGLALSNSKIRSKKRLFMTATERIIRPWIKNRSEQANQPVFSMDDEAVYGSVFDRYTFGEAIEDGVISDYRVIITAIDSKEVSNLIERNRLVSEDISSNENITAENLYKQIVLAKTIEKFNIKKTITFHSSVKRAKNFINGASNVNFDLKTLLEQVSPDVNLVNHYFSSVDGNMSAGERNTRLKSFENSSIGIISNARCLTEGIDVPLIDSIYFVDPKNSLVDIVQACGRALRKPRSQSTKGYSLFIVPVIIEENTDLNNLDDDLFETVHNVIQALRDQDERLADWIDSINIGVARGNVGSGLSSGPIQIFLPQQFDLQSFAESIELRIAEFNRDPLIHSSSREIVRRSTQTKSFMPLGDYAYDTYLKNLVKPTINKFKNDLDELDTEALKVNHNNISHTLRVGLIEKIDNEKYRLTSKGKQFKHDEISFEEIMKESMLNFESKIAEGLYPYRTILKVLLEIKKFNYLEFLYGLYTIPNSSEKSLIDSINKIKEIRNLYPNLDILSQQNKENVLNILNDKYDVTFSFDEAWGSTTTKNKFLYFKNHLKLFKDITVQGDQISLEDKNKETIEKLLKSFDHTIPK